MDGKRLYASLPVRERGLKLFYQDKSGRSAGSLPVRERGLKHSWTNAENHYRRRRSPCGSVD